MAPLSEKTRKRKVLLHLKTITKSFAELDRYYYQLNHDFPDSDHGDLADMLAHLGKAIRTGKKYVDVPPGKALNK